MVRKGMHPKGFPAQQVVKLRYVDHVSLDAAATATAFHRFNATGIFDPDITGTGHQPYLRDEWQLFYNHYVVLGSKISIQAMPNTTSNQAGMVLGIYLSDDTTTASTFLSLVEKGQTHYKMVPQGRQTVTKLDYKFSTKEYFNVEDVKDNLDRLGAGIGSDPTDNAVFNIFYSAVDGSANPASIDVLVTIDYIVSFSEPKEISQS